MDGPRGSTWVLGDVVLGDAAQQLPPVAASAAAFARASASDTRLIDSSLGNAGRLLRLCLPLGFGALGFLVASGILQAQPFGFLTRLIGVAAAGFEQDTVVFPIELVELVLGKIGLGRELRRRDPALGDVQGRLAFVRTRRGLRERIQRLARLHPVGGTQRPSDGSASSCASWADRLFKVGILRRVRPPPALVAG